MEQCDFVKYFTKIEVLCHNVGTAKGYIKQESGDIKNKLARESNKFMKIPKDQFKKQMREQLNFKIKSKALGSKSIKQDETFLANPVNFVMSMLRSGSVKNPNEKELPDEQYQENENPIAIEPEKDE